MLQIHVVVSSPVDIFEVPAPEIVFPKLQACILETGISQTF